MAGNTAYNSQIVTLDTVTTVTIDQVSGDDIIGSTEARSLRVTGTGEAGSTVTVDDRGNATTTAVSGSDEVSSSGVWSITLVLNTLNAGNLDFTAVAVDVAGNAATDTRVVNYDPSSMTYDHHHTSHRQRRQCGQHS